MARYIDADALYKETEKKIAAANSYRMAVVDSDFLDLINDAFAEDVVPKSEADKWYYEYHAIKDELKQEKMYHGETEKLADRYCAELQTAKSEVDRLKKALEAQDAEYSQALHDKAREYNMVVDKICIEHRAEYARLHEAHQEELAKAKREVARKIFADIELLIDKYSIEPNYLLLHLRKDIAEFKKQHNKN